MAVVTMKQLLESGVHFGHQTRRWNPKMAPFIYAQRNGIHILDLAKSAKHLEAALVAANKNYADAIRAKEGFAAAVKNKPEREAQAALQAATVYAETAARNARDAQARLDAAKAGNKTKAEAVKTTQAAAAAANKAVGEAADKAAAATARATKKAERIAKLEAKLAALKNPVGTAARKANKKPSKVTILKMAA